LIVVCQKSGRFSRHFSVFFWRLRNRVSMCLIVSYYAGV
jgi:hypothetical protein